MPHGLKRFKHGGVEYPLKAETTNTLLKDSDPAIHYALDLLATVIDEYIGERLLAQAALEGFNLPSAVETRIHYEPSPFLQSHEMVFPIFALYRSESAWDSHTVTFDKDTSIWSWAYILPPLTPRQIDKLNPILRSVEVVVSTFASHSHSYLWEDGKTLRDMSGIMKMMAGPARFADFEKIDGGQDEWWRAITGKLFVQERADIVFEDLDVFEGVNATLDLDDPGGAVESFLETKSYRPPVISQILPDSGTKGGAAYFEIIGTGFRPGTPAKVLIGGSYASAVYIASPFKITGLTPAHDAHPTFAADVQVFDADGQASNVLTGAYTFTTP